MFIINKCLMLTVNSSNNTKYLKVYCQKVESATEWQTSVNIWEVSYSNLETRRYGPKSCSKELSLQQQLQIKFRYWCDKHSSEAQSTRYWLQQSSRKFAGQNTDVFFWINEVSDVSLSKLYWAGLFNVVPLACCVAPFFGFISHWNTPLFTAPFSN